MVLSTLRSNNQLLASLSDTEWPCWQPWLELVELPAGKLLFEAGRQIEHVHFPLTALVALYHVTESGASAELALVGHEGLVGVSSFMGGGGRSAMPWCSVPARPCACLPRPCWAASPSPARCSD